MMSESGEYNLFDGFDFGSFFFRPDNMEMTATASAPTTPSNDQWTFPARPITKTESPDFSSANTHSTPIPSFPAAMETTVTITTGITTTTTTNNTVGESLHSPTPVVSRRGRLRSSSCSSGGSDGGPAHAGVQCAFCKRNGETREFYSTHILKDWRGMVVCPVLRAYTCPRCGASGDHAHTESHCPLSGNEPSLMATLRTQRRSCGKKAYSWKH